MGAKYSVGGQVHVTNSHSLNPTPMVYEIIRLSRESDGNFSYKLRSRLNGDERWVREAEIQLIGAGPNLPKAEEVTMEHKPSKAAAAQTQKKLLGWWVLTIVLASPGAMFLTAAFQSPDRDAFFAALPGTFLSLTALALYLHKLRPRQVYLSNRARAEGLARGAFTE